MDPIEITISECDFSIQLGLSEAPNTTNSLLTHLPKSIVPLIFLSRLTKHDMKPFYLTVTRTPLESNRGSGIK